MGSRSTWPEELAKRCRAVGWEAEIVKNGHYKVRTHEGKTFGIAVSPSDGNGYKNAERKANSYGLAKRELMFKLQRERDRLQRIEADRASAETDEGTTMTVKAKQRGQLGYIKDVAIIEIGAALLQTPRTQGEGSPLKFGEKVTLENGDIRYRCTMRTDAGPCYRDFPSAQSVASHWKAHKPKTEVAPTSEPQTDTDTDTGTKVEPGIIARLERLIEHVEALSDNLDDLADSFDVAKKDLHAIVHDLPEYIADAETREKIKQYEQLKAQLSAFMQ